MSPAGIEKFMKTIVVSEEKMDEVFSKDFIPGYRIGCVSSLGLPTGSVRVTFLPEHAFKEESRLDDDVYKTVTILKKDDVDNDLEIERIVQEYKEMGYTLDLVSTNLDKTETYLDFISQKDINILV